MAEQRIVPFSPPDISRAEINEVAEALRSGWITTGPRTKFLEQKIAEWIGTEKGGLLSRVVAITLGYSSLIEKITY